MDDLSGKHAREASAQAAAHAMRGGGASMSRYLRLFTIGVFGLLGLVAAFNWAVDPYDYWGNPRIEGFDRFKPEAHRHLIAGKLKLYARMAPATIVAGNSRTEVGVDPDAVAAPARLKPIYNFVLPGYDTESVVDVVERAVKLHKPQAIYLGVDFIDFRISQKDWRASVAPAEPKQAEGWSDQLSQLASLTLSLDALSDSVGTVLAQRAQHPGNTTPAGHSVGEFDALVPTEGHAALFAQRNADYRSRLLAGPKVVRWQGRGGNPDLAALERLAALCRREGIQLVVFTYPYHLDILRQFEDVGLWPAFADWKSMLADFSQRSGVPVWDFAHVDAFTTEVVPAKRDKKTKMRFYWESGHFKAALGDQMIEAMIRGGGYGGPIDPATIAADHAHLADHPQHSGL